MHKLLNLWLHRMMDSECLLISDSLFIRIINASVMHKSQILLPSEYEWAFLISDQSIVKRFPVSFNALDKYDGHLVKVFLI